MAEQYLGDKSPWLSSPLTLSICPDYPQPHGAWRRDHHGATLLPSHRSWQPNIAKTWSHSFKQSVLEKLSWQFTASIYSFLPKYTLIPGQIKYDYYVGWKCVPLRRLMDTSFYHYNSDAWHRQLACGFNTMPILERTRSRFRKRQCFLDPKKNAHENHHDQFCPRNTDPRFGTSSRYFPLWPLHERSRPTL